MVAEGHFCVSNWCVIILSHNIMVAANSSQEFSTCSALCNVLLYIITFNPHNHPLREVNIIIYIFQMSKL